MGVDIMQVLIKTIINGKETRKVIDGVVSIMEKNDSTITIFTSDMERQDVKINGNMDVIIR